MKSCKINKGHVVLKAHYFLYNAGLAGAMPFFVVYAKQLGISAIAIGIIFTVLHFLTLVCKPFFGGIADRFHVPKPMLVVFILLIISSTIAMNFIPTNQESQPPGNHSLFKDSAKSKCWNDTSFPSCAFCQSEILKEHSGNYSECDPEFEKYLREISSVLMQFSALNESISKGCPLVCCFNGRANWTLFDYPNCEVVIIGALQNLSENVKDRFSLFVSDGELLWNVTSQQRRFIPCPKISASDCDKERNQRTVESGSLRLSVFSVLVVISWVSINVATSLSDALCYHALDDKPHLYGKQRVWGAIGWGSFAALSGYLNNVFTSNSTSYNYSPGFYVLVALMFVDLIAVAKLDHTAARATVNIPKDIGRLIIKPLVAAFLFGAFLFGAATGFYRTYYLWYLRTLGASQLLLGATSASRCFIGELPFFFFSGVIMRKIGHINTMTLSFIADGIRFVAYSYVQELWWILIVEVLQGGFALFYASMTAYAKIIAPPGTEATMQGLVGGTLEGLGCAVGSLLGGLSLEYFDARYTFFWAGIFSFFGGILHAMLQVSVNGCNSGVMKSELAAKEGENQDKSAYGSLEENAIAKKSEVTRF